MARLPHLADSRFVIHFCDSHRLYGNIPPFKHPHPNVSKATRDAGQPRKIEIVRQQVGFWEISYPPAQPPENTKGKRMELRF